MLHEIKKYWNLKSPLFQFTLVIYAYSILALLNLLRSDIDKKLFFHSLFGFLLIFGTLKLFYFLNFYSFKIKNVNPLHLIITGSIIYLLVHPTTDLWIFPMIVLITLMAKMVVRWKGKPIFNPAAFGLFLSIYLLDMLNQSLRITWWGADFGSRNINISEASLSIFPIIFSVMFFYIAYKFKKHIYGICFLLSFVAWLFLYSFLKLDGITLKLFLNLLLIGFPTWMFMIFVMIVEPKTSPILKRDQIILGSIGGLLYLLVLKYATGLESRELHIILILNLINFLFFSNESKARQWIIKRTKIVRIVRN